MLSSKTTNGSNNNLTFGLDSSCYPGSNLYCVFCLENFEVATSFVHNLVSSFKKNLQNSNPTLFNSVQTSTLKTRWSLKVSGWKDKGNVSALDSRSGHPPLLWWWKFSHLCSHITSACEGTFPIKLITVILTYLVPKIRALLLALFLLLLSKQVRRILRKWDLRLHWDSRWDWCLVLT